MNKTTWAIILILLLIAVGGLVYMVGFGTANAPTTHTPATGGENDTLAGIPDLISVSSPTRGAKIASPLTITGSARGTWYFEASFPVEIKDAGGNTIAQAPAQAQGDWMTENFVPFTITLSFPAQASGSQGTVILHKDNPSGDPERDQSVEIPVVF